MTMFLIEGWLIQSCTCAGCGERKAAKEMAALGRGARRDSHTPLSMPSFFSIYLTRSSTSSNSRRCTMSSRNACTSASILPARASRLSSRESMPSSRYNAGSAPGPNNLIGTDPGFVIASAGAFHLTSGSLARDAGVSLPDVPCDIDGDSRPAGSVYDIGAYEYGGTPAQTCPKGGGGGGATPIPPPTQTPPPVITLT